MTPAEIDELRHLLKLAQRQQERQVAACAGKVRFATWGEARRGTRRRELEAYHCADCSGWHVGAHGLERGWSRRRGRLFGRRP